MGGDDERQHAGSIEPLRRRWPGRGWIGGLVGLLVGASIGGFVVETSRRASLRAATTEIHRQAREIEGGRGKSLELILDNQELSTENHELREALKARMARSQTQSARLAKQYARLAKLRTQLGFDARYEVAPDSFPITVRYEIGSGSFRITPEELWWEMGLTEIRGRISYLGGLGCRIATATVDVAYFEGGRVVGTQVETLRRLRSGQGADLLITSLGLTLTQPDRASITVTEAACASGQ